MFVLSQYSLVYTQIGSINTPLTKLFVNPSQTSLLL